MARLNQYASQAHFLKSLIADLRLEFFNGFRLYPIVAYPARVNVINDSMQSQILNAAG
jgi:hypothetical protein